MTWYGAIGTLAVVAATLGLAAPASAKARGPLLSMGYAKHAAWETTQDYKETREGNWTGGVDEVAYRCRRVNRSTIDCKTSMLFWNSEGGCVMKADPVHSEACPEGTEYEEWWEGERHSWTMRYRAIVHRGHLAGVKQVVWYFLRDRYAEIDPTESKFGGTALRKTDEQGEFE